MKKFLSLLTVGTFLFLPHSPAYASAQEGIVAIVNDSVITATDLRDRTHFYVTTGQNRPTNAEQQKRMTQQVLSRLIDEALQLQQAKKMGIAISQTDVKEGFADLSRQNNSTPEEFKKRLEAAGAPVDSLYSQIKADIAWSQVVRRRIRPELNITESEIDMTINQIAHTTGKKQFRVAEIFLGVPSPVKEGEVRAEAEKLVTQLTQGASFSQIAHSFSQAPGASNGGDLGWISEGNLDDELNKAVEKMQPGQVSPPIRSARGYHILMLRDARMMNGLEAPSKPLPTNEGPIVTLRQIGLPIAKTEPDDVVAAKLARAKALKEEVKSCEAMAERMKEFPSPSTGDLGTGTQNTLPPSMRALAEKMAVNEMSEPVRDENGVFVFMICDRKDPVDAAKTATVDLKDEAARDKVAQQLGMKRLDQMAQRYLQDLRATAFIDIRL